MVIIESIDAQAACFIAHGETERFIKFSCFVEIWNLEREMIDRMYAEDAHPSFQHSLIGHDPLLDDSHAIRNQVPNRESCNLSQCAAKLPYRKAGAAILRSEEHTSELQSLMRISYAVFCLKKKKSKTIKV